jgi:hypothetical protein
VTTETLKKIGYAVLATVLFFVVLFFVIQRGS